MTTTRAVLRTDGGARGNPGPAGAGFVLEDRSGSVLRSGGRYLGETTNNVAEYEALIWGLEVARSLGIRDVHVLCDSELVVRQMMGAYRVKHENLKPLFARAQSILEGFESWTIEHVRREGNAAADALVNEAIDLRATVGDVAANDSSESTEQASLFDGDPGVDRTAERALWREETGVYELTVKGHFDAAHALRGYPGECRELHGHTWDIEVTVEGQRLDDIGILYDFKALKADLGEVLAAYDHAYLNEVPPFDEISPTAENLARVLHEALSAKVDPRVRVSSIAVWESPIAKLVYRP